MAETVGRVDIIADIDGRGLERDIRALGNRVGKQLGKNLSNSASKEISKLGAELESDMRKHGEFAGINFTNSLQRILRSRLSGITDQVAEAFSGKDTLRKYVEDLGGVEEGSKKLRAQLLEMNEAGALSDKMFNRLSGTLAQSQGVWRKQAKETEAAQQELAELEVVVSRMVNTQKNFELGATLDALALKKQADAAKDASTALGDVDKAMEKNTRTSDKSTQSIDAQTSAWRRLPHGARQFLFFTGLFAALGDEIAILGSAAGSSLTVLAGALGATGVGVGTTIAAFQDLNGEISELPENIQPAAEAFQSIGDAFGLMQDAIQSAALDNAAGAFESLRGTVESLTPAFEIVGEAVGRVLDTFAASVAPGTAGFENLFRLVEASAPIFETLASATFIFGEALGDVFVASIPFVEIFAGYLQELAQQFSDFTNSAAGQSALQEWFQNGITVMQAIEPLIAAVADALNGLVTPKSIADLVDLLGTLTEFTPILGDILGAIGDLNIFGILADLLLAIGQVIQPLLPAISEFGAILGEVVTTALQALVPPLVLLMASLAPLLPIIAELALGLVQALIPALVPLSDALITVIDAVIPLLPSISELAVLLVEHLVEAFLGLLPVILPFLEQLATMIELLTPIMPLIIQLVDLALVPFMATTMLILPIVGKFLELLLLLVTPLVDLFKPILDNKKAMDDLSTATDALESTMDGFKGMLGDWASAVSGFLDGVIDAIKGVIGWFNDLFDVAGDAPSATSVGESGRGRDRLMAAGGTVYGRTNATIGEAGPEAVVPLNRPLSQVDPSVRMLSAFAQGISGYGGGGPAKIVNVQPGAIVVQTVAPTMQVANAVLDRLVANVAV